ERLALRVLPQVEDVGEHRRRAEPLAEAGQRLGRAGRSPELGPALPAPEPELAPPDPRDEVAPVVEVPVRDDDRVQAGPAVLAQPKLGEGAGAAVDEQPAGRSVDHVAGVSAARVGPRGGAPDDGEPHLAPYTAAPDDSADSCGDRQARVGRA